MPFKGKDVFRVSGLAAQPVVEVGKGKRMLPKGWRWVRLGEVSDRVDYGVTASADGRADGPHLLRITDIQNGVVNWDGVPRCTIPAKEEESNSLRSGDVVVPRTGGTVGKSFLISQTPPRAVFASYLIRIRLSTEVVPAYLQLFFQSKNYWEQIQSLSRGGAQPNVNATMLRSLTVPLAPLAEQQLLARLMGDRLMLVERARAAAESQLAAADALLFSAVRSVFSGTAAHGWRRLPLGDCARLLNGRAYSQHELLDTGTPVVRIQNLNGGQRWYYSDLQLPQDKYCETGDLLFAWSASFGPYWWTGLRAIYHYHIWKVLPSPAMLKEFLYYVLQWITLEVKASAHGSAMVHVTKADMERWPVPVPGIDVQQSLIAALNAGNERF